MNHRHWNNESKSDTELKRFIKLTFINGKCDCTLAQWFKTQLRIKRLKVHIDSANGTGEKSG